MTDFNVTVLDDVVIYEEIDELVLDLDAVSPVDCVLPLVPHIVKIVGCVQKGISTEHEGNTKRSIAIGMVQQFYSKLEHAPLPWCHIEKLVGAIVPAVEEYYLAVYAPKPVEYKEPPFVGVYDTVPMQATTLDDMPPSLLECIAEGMTVH